MKLGLALAGGGLQGVAHIGVIRALNELGIKFDFVSGTSSGSIFAVLYSLGFKPEEMEEIISKRYKVLTNIPKSRIAKIVKEFVFYGDIKTEGLIDGIVLENLITDIIKDKNVYKMQDAPIPLAIPTVDTISTKECIFLSQEVITPSEGIDYIYDVPISKAIRSSMAFPGIYTTSNYDKYNFIDGGTKDNLPIQVLKDMGADLTLGLSFSIDHYIPSQNLLEVALRAVDLFSQKDVKKAQSIADVYYEIDTHGTSLLEITNIKECIEYGYNIIMDNKEEIIEKLHIEKKNENAIEK